MDNAGDKMKRAMRMLATVVTVAGLCGCGKAGKSDQETAEPRKVSEAKSWEPEMAEQPDLSNATRTETETKEQAKPKNDTGAPPKLQTTCPVDGGRPRRDCFADQDGLRVFLCSTTCSREFGKDPGKYIGKMEDEGFTVAKIQTVCPVTGNAINKAAYADIASMRIYLCSANCVGTFGRDPGKYIRKQMMEGVVYDMAPSGGHNHGPGGHAPH
jgi:YHS domain-containing protein